MLVSRYAYPGDILRRLWLILAAGWLVQTAAADTIIIGALAYRGPDEALARWSATADYLSKHIPQHHFIIQPLELESLREAAGPRRIAAALASSSKVRAKAVSVARSAVPLPVK